MDRAYHPQTLANFDAHAALRARVRQTRVVAALILQLSEDTTAHSKLETIFTQALNHTCCATRRYKPSGWSNPPQISMDTTVQTTCSSPGLPPRKSPPPARSPNTPLIHQGESRRSIPASAVGTKTPNSFSSSSLLAIFSLVFAGDVKPPPSASRRVAFKEIV